MILQCRYCSLLEKGIIYTGFNSSLNLPCWLNLFHDRECGNLWYKSLLYQSSCWIRNWQNPCLYSKFIFRYAMHLSDGREDGFVHAIFFRKENVAKVILVSCFSIIIYTCINNISPLVCWINMTYSCLDIQNWIGKLVFSLSVDHKF